MLSRWNVAEKLDEKLEAQDPWVLSSVAHALPALAVALAVLIGRMPQRPIDLEVIDAPLAPTPAAPTIRTTQTKPAVKNAPPARAVFGVSRQAHVDTAPTEPAPEVKQGNTVAKTPDAEKLRPDDPDALPAPVEEYLVSAMPQVIEEYRQPYPPEAKQKQIEGPVVMDILVDSVGAVRDARLIEGPGAGLDEAAMAAIRRFRFKPAEVAGQAVAVRIRYIYRFVLER